MVSVVCGACQQFEVIFVIEEIANMVRDMLSGIGDKPWGRAVLKVIDWVLMALGK